MSKVSIFDNMFTIIKSFLFFFFFCCSAGGSTDPESCIISHTGQYTVHCPTIGQTYLYSLSIE